MLTLQRYIDKLLTLHDHVCPRQVLGLRMGLYAGELLDLDLPQADKRLFTFVENDGCFADGVMVATGCSLGHRTMHLMDFGKVGATFVDTQTSSAIRIAPRSTSRTAATALFPDIENRWQAQLRGYQVMPVSDLLTAMPVVLTLSLEKLISKPSQRTVCEICGEEITNEREIAVDGQLLCQSCAGDSYYRYCDQMEAANSCHQSLLLLDSSKS